MKWKRFMESSTTSLFLPFVSVLLCAFSLYGKSSILFVLACLLAFSGWFGTFHVKRMLRSVHIENAKQTIRLFPEDKYIWKTKFTNGSLLPIFKAKVNYTISSNVAVENLEPTERNKRFCRYQFSLHLQPKETVIGAMKVKGLKRGVAKVSTIEVFVSDVMNLFQGTLVNDRMLLTEFVIYPTPIHVANVEKLHQEKPGSHLVTASLYEDRSLSVGSRDYIIGDPVSNIHWKASARLPNIQTRVVEKTQSIAWTILMNLDVNRSASTGNSERLLENQLSHTAFICKYAIENGIPFELYVNVPSKGRHPFLYLEKGEGTSHLAKAFELLARIDITSIKLSMERLVSYHLQKEDRSTVMILIGSTSYLREFAPRLTKRGNVMYTLESSGEAASLVSYTARRAIG